MNDGEKTYISKEKLEEFKKELRDLKIEGRKEVAERLEYSKSLGDISENAEYQDARDAQATIEDRILTLESILKSAVVVEAHKGEMIDVGSLVVIRRDDKDENQTYTLVGSEEANVSLGKISNKSPMGEALFGKKRGDTFSYKSPRGEVKGVILKVE